MEKEKDETSHCSVEREARRHQSSLYHPVKIKWERDFYKKQTQRSNYIPPGERSQKANRPGLGTQNDGTGNSDF